MSKLGDDLDSESYLEVQRQIEEQKISSDKSVRLKKLDAELRSIDRRLQLSRASKDVAPSSLQTVFFNALAKIGAAVAPEQV